jgi:hypothetical protein
MYKRNSYNIYFVTFFYAIRNTRLLKQLKQKKQDYQFILELAGDLVGALSIFILLAISLFLGGIYS